VTARRVIFRMQGRPDVISGLITDDSVPSVVPGVNGAKGYRLCRQTPRYVLYEVETPDTPVTPDMPQAWIPFVNTF